MLIDTEIKCREMVRYRKIVIEDYQHLGFSRAEPAVRGYAGSDPHSRHTRGKGGKEGLLFSENPPGAKATSSPRSIRLEPKQHLCRHSAGLGFLLLFHSLTQWFPPLNIHKYIFKEILLDHLYHFLSHYNVLENNAD